MLHVVHTFEPVFNEQSEILILGSFPSVKSREGQFYYHHPQNRFWKLIAFLLGKETPSSIGEKKRLLLENKIAIWDVVKSCDIQGSSDSSIKNVVPNDLSLILNQAPIQQIYANGAKAYTLYQQYCLKELKRKIIKLPSTSPANAAWSMERLLIDWKRITAPN